MKTESATSYEAQDYILEFTNLSPEAYLAVGAALFEVGVDIVSVATSTLNEDTQTNIKVYGTEDRIADFMSHIPCWFSGKNADIRPTIYCKIA